MTTVPTRALGHLDRLEAESIHILRETVAEVERPVMLYSIGKDSAAMLHLALKAFYPSKPPFPLLHVNTMWKFKEMIAFRDKTIKELGVEMLEYINPQGIDMKISPFDHGSKLHTQIMKTEALKQALDKCKFDAAFGGARRDEEKSRAKERVLSFRTAQHRWDPKNQRPELWNLYNARSHKGENIRAFPISNWTEMDVWQYIEREKLELPSIYFAHQRPVVIRNGAIFPVNVPLASGEILNPPKADEKIIDLQVRFRTVGDITCTAPVESDADNVSKIVLETATTTITERGATRLDDQTSEASMEQRKKEGYF